MPQYPNHIDSIMCTPYLLRAALDTRAKTINNEMKLAAAEALADLCTKPTPQEVKNYYPKKSFEYGPDYIIPTLYDPRLAIELPIAVVKAAMETKVVRHRIKDLEQYRK